MNGIKNKFESKDVEQLIDDKDILVVTESHFGVRHKTPNNFIFIGRSKHIPTKKARGGVVVYKNSFSEINLKILCDTLPDMIVIEITNTSHILIATYIPPSNTKYYNDSLFDNLDLLITSFSKYRSILITGDLNSRISDRFPTHGLLYKKNPDPTINPNGYKLLDILDRHKLFVLNGLSDEGKSFDSKFTCIRRQGSSQVDLILSNRTNHTETLTIHDKLPQSDHCAVTVTLRIKVSPTLDLLNECAGGFNNYDIYDLSKRIKHPINIKKLNLLSLQADLTKLGESLSEKYNNIPPSQDTIDHYTNDLTNGLYACCKENYSNSVTNTQQPPQLNCTSKNFKAIAYAHKHRYENIVDNPDLAEHHKQEWLFYQTVAWEREEEELHMNKNNKWKSCCKDPKKFWRLLDYKGEVKTGTSSCPPKTVKSYFEDTIFNTKKITVNPVLKTISDEVKYYNHINETTDSQLTEDELEAAIKKYGTGISFDGLPGKILNLIPSSLRKNVLHLFRLVFHHFYPSTWRSQVLSPIEKKGHTLLSPKLRGIAVGPLFSRLYDIMIDHRFGLWYTPNSNQAGSRKKQGCPIQIFALFLVLDMAKCLGKTVFIGLLDFEKAFDYMNRPTLLKNMMDDGFGSVFVKNLNNMYEQIQYLPKISTRILGDPIISDHGVTQGRSSSGNIFSYYISDMNDSFENDEHTDFMVASLLQLADDSVILAEQVASLTSKFERIFQYCDKKYIVANMLKTMYMELNENPYTEIINTGTTRILPVDPSSGYDWLGFHLTYSSDIGKLVDRNIKHKRSNIAKFYAWLNVNKETPFPFKLQVMYACLFQAILYSCETWGDIESHRESLLLVERNALRAILGIKDSTPEDIVYIEVERNDIMLDIKTRQINFYRKFKENITPQESVAKQIWERYSKMSVQGPFFQYYESLSPPSYDDSMEARKRRVESSGKSMHIRYNTLLDCTSCSLLYNSMIDDRYRSIVTRWRLSCHPLYIETGRYLRPKITRSERKCKFCAVVEDEEHALFFCRAHFVIRQQHRSILTDYVSTKEILNPRSIEDVERIAKYLQEIEKNMSTLDMKK